MLTYDVPYEATNEVTQKDQPRRVCSDGFPLSLCGFIEFL